MKLKPLGEFGASREPDAGVDFGASRQVSSASQATKGMPHGNARYWKLSFGFRTWAIALTCIWLIAFAVIPNVALFLITFLRSSEQNFVSLIPTLDNYIQLLDPIFLRILLKSLILALASTGLCLLLGYPFALALTKVKPKYRTWLLLLIIIPFWTNSLVRTYALILVLRINGVLSTVVHALGFSAEPISFLYSDFAVFTGIAYTFLPFMILPLYTCMDKLDARLLDAARDLGASAWQAFWRITLPLTLPGILAGSMLVFLPSLGAFYIPEILGGAKTMLMGNFIKNQFLIARNWPLGAAASSILTLLLILLLLIYLLTRKKTEVKHA